MGNKGASDAVIVAGVSKTFRSGKDTIYALRDVSLTIRRGEIVGLLGPNGAGKTTLISLLIGLTTADQGTIAVCGMDVRRDLHKVQQSVNMVRGFGGVLDKMSVRELLRFYAMLYDVPDAERRIEELLRTVGLWDRRDQYVALLSSGWRQRFFIAKALLNSPKVLLLDEPTVGLDVDMAKSVRSLIRRLNRQGYTILLTTHYMKEAEELCDRIALISEGRIVAQGTPAELKRGVKKEEAIIITGALSAAARKRLGALAGVTGMSAKGNTLRLLVSDPAVMGAVMELLAKEKARAESVALAEPTLEDVFLKLTKHSLDATEDDDGDARE